MTSHMLAPAFGDLAPCRERWPAAQDASPTDTDRGSAYQDPVEPLADRLEEQFQRSTDRLVELTVCSLLPGRGGYDADTLAALIASGRQAVADTAQALRRMAEDGCGTCGRGTADLPL